ncbi:MAG: outer membrane beta-barrel protein [Chlamydiota bacterium]
MNKWIQNSLIAACTLACLSLTAEEPAQQQQQQDPHAGIMGIYFGGFGGWIFPYNVSVAQHGTVFFPEANGGALAVDAKGHAHGRTKGFGGVHIGYEWMNPISPGFRLAPAVEIEGMYFANTAKKAHLITPTTRPEEGEFVDKLPMRVGTLLANGILEFNNDYISPYVGVGVGAGFVSIHGASSSQVNPPEPGIDHFNSGRSDFTSVFATQAKAGLRYRFLRHYRLSAEYRFLYLTSSHFIFGSTSDPSHVPTSPWTVKLGGLAYNGVTLGLDFIF